MSSAYARPMIVVEYLCNMIWWSPPGVIVVLFSRVAGPLRACAWSVSGAGFNTRINSPARHNFTFAHELGHYFLDHKPNYAQNGQLSIKCTLSETDTEQKGREREANLFAVELLMPESRFGLLMAGAEIDFALVSALATEFMVSKQSCSYRIAELTKKPCVIIFSKNGFITGSTSSRAAKTFFDGHKVLPNDTFAFRCANEKIQQSNFTECDSDKWLLRAIPNQRIYECTRGSYNDGVAMTILKW